MSLKKIKVMEDWESFGAFDVPKSYLSSQTYKEYC
jgi:hypothetical protein